MSARHRVAHLIRTYLPPSETFVHGQIVSARTWEALVVARRARGAERFSLGGRRLLLTDELLPGAARRWASLQYRARRLTGPEVRHTAAELQRMDVRLLHAHFGTDARFFRPLYRALGRPLVTSFYGYDAQQFPRRWMGLGARYLRPVLAESRLLLAPCRDMARDLESLGAAAERIEVLPWGIDTARFKPARRVEEADGQSAWQRPVRFAIACRFTAKKGVADLLEAFGRILPGPPVMELTIAGEGPLREDYLARIRRLGIGSAVRLRPFVSAQEMPGFLGDQDIFVHPSVTGPDGDKEGTPTVIMEAQAAGLPVVATLHAGIPDIVADGESGHLVQEGDVEALAQRMLELARDPALRARFGVAGRRRIAADFNRETQTERRERLYDRLVREEEGRA